jgi:hypothetical protein
MYMTDKLSVIIHYIVQSSRSLASGQWRNLELVLGRDWDINLYYHSSGAMPPTPPLTIKSHISQYYINLLL